MGEHYCKCCGRATDRGLSSQSDYQVAICNILNIEEQKYITKQWIVDVYDRIIQIKDGQVELKDGKFIWEITPK